MSPATLEEYPRSETTADLLGHASTRILKDVYQHAEADDKRAVVKAIGRLFKTRATRKKATRKKAR